MITRFLLILLALFAQPLSSYSQAASPTGSNARYLSAMSSSSQFDTFARVDHLPRADTVSSVMFVIDRQDSNKIYYVNSKRFRFHQYFVNALYLSLETGDTFLNKNYLDDNRRFILGTLASRSSGSETPTAFTFEYWEGDRINAALIKLTDDLISRTFFAPVAFRPNSAKQDEDSAQLGIPRILQSDINAARDYQAFNIARSIGRVHFIETLDEQIEIAADDIIVLNEVPLQLPPVAGIIIAKPSTALSHVNLLAKGWGIPNAYLKEAKAIAHQFDKQWVAFETKSDGYTVRLATQREIDKHSAKLLQAAKKMRARFDLDVTKLARLSELRKSGVIAYGGKSANLGEVVHARSKDFTVPNGFAIPFFYYAQFVQENGLQSEIDAMLANAEFLNNRAVRRDRLRQLRDTIQHGVLNRELRSAVLKKLADEYANKGVFVRSSSNSEDLPNFSGAGLYTSVPNVQAPEKILEAIKTVWASLWNYEAFEARARKQVKHADIYMGVLIQEGINSESSGVIITTDPFDTKNLHSVYIAAKRGLGTRVVEGQKVAEQVLYDPRTHAVKVLTRSEEDSLVTFDEHGGVKEAPIPRQQIVLTDAMAHRLATSAIEIEKIFNGKIQDIEWATMKGQIYIVQSRPFVSR